MICNTYVQFFKTLADPSKLEIINLLKDKELSVSDICKKTNFEQSRCSHTLRKLKELGFVIMTPNGKERLYDIDRKTVLPLLEIIQKHVDIHYHKFCKCKGTAKKLRWSR